MCRAEQRAAEHLAGRTLRCQQCGKPFVVPSAARLPLVANPVKPAPPVQDEDQLFGEHDSDSIFGD